MTSARISVISSPPKLVLNPNASVSVCPVPPAAGCVAAYSAFELDGNPV